MEEEWLVKVGKREASPREVRLEGCFNFLVCFFCFGLRRWIFEREYH